MPRQGKYEQQAWQILLSLVLIVAAVAKIDAAAPRDPSAYFFQDSFGDLAEEAETAEASGLFGVMIMFETADCPWCLRMKETVLNNIEVQRYYRRYFRVLVLNAEGEAPMSDFQGKEMTEKEFALEAHRVRATPLFAFFDTRGRLLLKYTGTTRNTQEFLWLGEFVVDGHYLNERFSQYKRRRRAAS